MAEEGAVGMIDQVELGRGFGCGHDVSRVTAGA
jgi:hypothetical protein